MADWTKSWKKELESDIWKMPPIYHRVWYYLRQKAIQFTPWECPTKYNFKITLLPGQLITSIETIAKEVSWTEWGVEKKPNKKIISDILRWLEFNKMVMVESNAYGTFVNIVNWGIYQDSEQKKVTVESNDLLPQKKRLMDTILEEEKKKIEIKDNNKDLSDFPNRTVSAYSENFNLFWNQLPSQMKVGKKAAFRHYCSSVKNEVDYSDLKTALENYKRTERFNRGVIQNGSTWFNNWRDWLEYEEPNNGKIQLSPAMEKYINTPEE